MLSEGVMFASDKNIIDGECSDADDFPVRRERGIGGRKRRGEIAASCGCVAQRFARLGARRRGTCSGFDAPLLGCRLLARAI